MAALEASLSQDLAPLDWVHSLPQAEEAPEALLRRYAERFRILHEIDQAILGARSAEAIAVGALSRVRPLVPYSRGSIVTLNAVGEPQVLAVIAGSGWSSDLTGWLDLLPAAISDQPRIQGAVDLATLADRSSLQQRLATLGVRSYLLVPLVTLDGLLGTLNLEAAAPHAFTREHVETVASIAGLIAVAMQQAQLRASLQQELAERRQTEIALRASEAAFRKYAAELELQNAELDAFAHTVAHDLKNPLAAVIGYAQLMQASRVPLPDQPAQYTAMIVESGRRMLRIVQALLLLAGVRRMEEVPMDALSMAAIVDDVQKGLADMITSSDAEVVTPARWPVAYGYAPWVEEVWANYISNGLKYGGQPPRLRLGADRLPAGAGRPRAMVRFWIADNGPGIRAEDREQLFTPFTRLSQARISGHGLGLSIVQRIVDRLGGQVGVETPPGGGCRFYFTLAAEI